jgi:general secretion pathway protein I
MNSNTIKKTYGFTLLEIMISLSIIAIALTAIFKLHSQSLSMNFSTDFYTIAPMLAQKKMAEVKFIIDDTNRDFSGDFSDLFPEYKWHIEVKDTNYEYLGTAGENFKQVDVTITLSSNNMKYNLRQYSFY